MRKTVVVTGGASGIGAAVVARLNAANCRVYVLDVAQPTVPDIEFVACDLARPEAIDAAAAALPARLDALVNVAGIASAERAETVVAVNFLGLRHVTESLVNRVSSGGSIVNVASSAGRDWQKCSEVVGALLDTADYVAGLDWLRANGESWRDNPYKFSKQCAAAYTYRAVPLGLDRGVRVNCVNPGSTGTQLTPAFRELVGPELYDWGVAQVGREGTPDDIAEVIEYLAIGPCRWLNGVEIVVDGGYIAGLVGGWIDPARAQQPVG
jgi:NAD(P)-dependent dehydrogenase (short-subunit alcohol dehydrogenase family)